MTPRDIAAAVATAAQRDRRIAEALLELWMLAGDGGRFVGRVRLARWR